MIGIGVTTRNRGELARQCIENIIKNTDSPYKLIIIDDASDVPYEDHRAHVIRNRSRKGVAASKNACLRALAGSSHFFLFDDDCWPVSKGWERKYIEAGEESGCHLMCFMWNTMTDGSPNNFCEVEKTVVYRERIFLDIDGKHIQIDEERVKRIQQYKMELGYGYGWNHAISKEIDLEIGFYKNGSGAMMYMDKICIERIGGFYEGFPMYGGEHVDYYVRGYNAGLSPHKFTDIIGSEDLFYAMDRKPESEREFISTSRMDHNEDNSQEILAQRINSTEKVNI